MSPQPRQQQEVRDLPDGDMPVDDEQAPKQGIAERTAGMFEKADNWVQQNVVNPSEGQTNEQNAQDMPLQQNNEMSDEQLRAINEDPGKEQILNQENFEMSQGNFSAAGVGVAQRNNDVGSTRV